MKLLEKARKGEIILLVQDELLINVVPTVTYQWMPKGRKTMRIKVRNLRSPKDKRVAVFGAGNLVTGQVHRFTAATINKEAFLRSLRRLANYYDKKYPGRPVYMVIDGHPAHRAHIITDWVDAQQHFNFYWLPKNSPEINPIEYFWKKLRKEVTHNRVYRDMQSLKTALTRFFNRWYARLRTLKEWFSSLIQNIWKTDTLSFQVG